MATGTQLRLAQPSASHLPCAHQLLLSLVHVLGHGKLLANVHEVRKAVVDTHLPTIQARV